MRLLGLHNVRLRVCVQAKKRFPQLAEHASRMRCGNLPPGALTEFMQSILKRPTAANYDNVIATSSFYTDDDDDQEPEEPVSQQRNVMGLQLAGVLCI